MLRQASKPIIAIAFLTAGHSIAAAAAASAQDPAAQIQEELIDTTEAAPRPQPITASELATREEETTARLRQTRANLEPDPEVEEIRGQLSDLLATKEEFAANPALRDLQALSRRSLESLQQQWALLKNDLDAWQSALAERSQALVADRDTLSSIRAVWQMTADSARARDLPAAAIERIRSVLSAIDETAAELQTRLDAVLTVQSRVADQVIEVGDVLANIEGAEQTARLRLFMPDSRPLWAVFGADYRAASLTAVRDYLEANLAALSRYVDDQSQYMLGMLVIFVTLLGLLFGLRARAEERAKDDPELEAARHIFRRPISAALLVFLLLFSQTSPQLPLPARDLLRILILVPVLRLLPGLLPQSLRRPLYALAGLYLLQALGGAFPEGSLFYRVHTLVVTALALLGLAWLVRSGALEFGAPASGRGWQTFARLSRAAVFILGASLIANILGFVELSDLLTGATILSALIAAAAYAIAQVLSNLVILLLRTKPAQALESIRKHRKLLTGRAVALIKLGLAIIWLFRTLVAFDLWDPVLVTLGILFNSPLSIGSVSISLGDILAFVIAIWIAVLASRFVRFVLQEDVLPRLDLPRGVPGMISKVATYTILGIGLVIAFGAAGIDFSSVTILVGALGVGIGFGLQNVVNNFISGLILIFERPIQVGDTIELDTLVGKVVDIGIRASIVRTLSGAEVIVPNGDLIAGRVVNWTMSDRLRRLEVTVGVAYGTDPHKVLNLLIDTVSAHEEVLQEPEPAALFTGFGDSSLDFTVRAWTASENWWKVQSELTTAVHDAIYDAGIVIPFPQRDLHLMSMEPSIPTQLGLAKHAPAENPRKPAGKDNSGHDE